MSGTQAAPATPASLPPSGTPAAAAGSAPDAGKPAPAGNAAATPAASAAPASGEQGAAPKPAAAQLPKAEGNVLGDGLGAKEGEAAPAEEGAKPEGEKPAEEAPAEPIDPKSYLEGLKLPEGVTAEDPVLTAFLEGAAKGGMDAESVQAIVESIGPKMQETLAAPYQAWKDLQETWQGAVKADTEIGGDKLPGVVSTINRALTAVCGDMIGDIKTALETTGAGNNPAVIKAMYRMAKGLVEPSGPVTGTPPNPQPAKNPAKLLYPSAARQTG